MAHKVREPKVKLSVHQRIKEPPYPLGTPVLVRFRSCKYFRSGKIITDGSYGYELEPIKGTQFWQRLPKPLYYFVQDRDGKKLVLQSPGFDMEIKFPDGRPWKCDLTWYSPSKIKIGDGPWQIHLVPKGWPTSSAEAMALEAST